LSRFDGCFAALLLEIESAKATVAAAHGPSIAYISPEFLTDEPTSRDPELHLPWSVQEEASRNPHEPYTNLQEKAGSTSPPQLATPQRRANSTMARDWATANGVPPRSKRSPPAPTRPTVHQEGLEEAAPAAGGSHDAAGPAAGAAAHLVGDTAGPHFHHGRGPHAHAYLTDSHAKPQRAMQRAAQQGQPPQQPVVQTPLCRHPGDIPATLPTARSLVYQPLCHSGNSLWSSQLDPCSSHGSPRSSMYPVPMPRSSMYPVPCTLYPVPMPRSRASVRAADQQRRCGGSSGLADPDVTSPEATGSSCQDASCQDASCQGSSCQDASRQDASRKDSPCMDASSSTCMDSAFRDSASMSGSCSYTCGWVTARHAESRNAESMHDHPRPTQQQIGHGVSSAGDGSIRNGASHRTLSPRLRASRPSPIELTRRPL